MILHVGVLHIKMCQCNVFFLLIHISIFILNWIGYFVMVDQVCATIINDKNMKKKKMKNQQKPGWIYLTLDVCNVIWYFPQLC